MISSGLDELLLILVHEIFDWNELKIYYGIRNPESRLNVVSSREEGCSIQTS